MEYAFKDIEKKWQEIWVKNGAYKVLNESDKPKYYVLDMFHIRVVQVCMLGILWAISPVMCLAVTKEQKGSMYCIQWDMILLVCRPSNMQLNME